MQAWQLVLTLGLFSSPALSVHPKSASTTYRLGASGKRFVCMHAACCKPFVSGTACRKHCRIQHPVWLGRFGRAVGSCSGSADWYVVMDTEPADELAALSTEELAKAKELANAQMQAETAQAEADEKTAKAKMQADEKAAKAKMHAEKTQAKADEKAKRQAENAAAMKAEEGVAYRQRQLAESGRQAEAQTKRDEVEMRKKQALAHAKDCRELAQRVRDAPDNAEGEAAVEELEAAMDVRSKDGSRRYLWGGDQRATGLEVLKVKAQRMRKAEEEHVLSDFSPEAREAILKGSKGKRVCRLFQLSVPYEICRFIAIGRLDKRFARAAAAFREVGWQCKARGMFNTVGDTVRTILKDRGVTREDIMTLIEVFAANPPLDKRLINDWTQYAYWCLHSRYDRDSTFPGGQAEIKHGDTQELAHFDNPRMTNQSPVSRRYGGPMYEHIMQGSECYYEGRGTRELRALTELDFDWLASEKCHAFGFRVHEATGDEGLLGPSNKAEAALCSMIAEVKLYPAYRVAASGGAIFIAAWQRTGGGGWQRQ